MLDWFLKNATEIARSLRSPSNAGNIFNGFNGSAMNLFEFVTGYSLLILTIFFSSLSLTVDRVSLKI